MRISIVLIDRTVPGIRELMKAVRDEFKAEVVRDMIHLGATRAFRKERNQYDAEVLLQEVSRFRSLVDRTLFIFREDLFVQNMNFIFGLAAGDVCIVSTTRLDPRFYQSDRRESVTTCHERRLVHEHDRERDSFATSQIDQIQFGNGEVEDPAEAKELFKERLIKEALHELGHAFGLPHCDNKRCVMVFSNSIKDVDFKGAKFCEGCATVLTHIIKEYG